VDDREAKGLLIAVALTLAVLVAKDIDESDDRLLRSSERRGSPRNAWIIFAWLEIEFVYCFHHNSCKETWKILPCRAERKTVEQFFFVSPMVKPGWMCTIVYGAFGNYQPVNHLTPLSDRNRHDVSTSSTSSSMQLHRRHHRHHYYHDTMEHMNILIVCHGLTLRWLLMREFQLTV
jgi:hypothetical protein